MCYRTVVKTTKPDNQIWYLVSWYDTGCGLQRPSYIIYPDGNWWQLMATDGNITDPQYRKQYRWEINYAGLHQPSQCQVHSKSADTINTVRLTGTGLDTKLSYTIYDDRIIPTLFTHWQMCKDNTSIAHTLTDVQINSIGDSPVLPIPRWLSEWKLLDEKACGTGQHSSVRTSMPFSHFYPYKSLSSMI